MREVLNVTAEEITESQKLPDLFNVAGRLGLLNCFQFVAPREDSLLSEPEPEIGGFIGSEHTFFQIYPEIVGCQPSKYCIQSREVLLVILGVDDQVIDVDDHLGNAFYHLFH